MAGEGLAKPYVPGALGKLTCNFSYTDPAKLDRFALNFYPNTAAWSRFDGVDLVPERSFEYPEDNAWRRGLRRWEAGKNGPVAQSELVRFAECEVPQKDGGAYIVQRVGPFVSTGGYDFWQVGWRDAWGVSRLLQKHPEGVFATEWFSGAVTSQGAALGYPPIYVDHVHVSPEPGVRYKLAGSNGSTPITNAAFEQHGDYECVASDGGSDCLFERTPDGHAKLVDRVMDLTGQLSDVRAADSEPMTWWYQTVLRWRPRTPSLRPLSQTIRTGLGQNSGNQYGTLSTFPAKTRDKSMIFYSGRMEIDGAMLRNRLHAHGRLLDRAFFFRATPAELGLQGGLKDFTIRSHFTPVLLRDVGFWDFEGLQEYLFRNLEEAAKEHDRSCEAATVLASDRDRCAEQRPAIVCNAWASTADVMDAASGLPFAYDRRVPSCCRPWSFHAGDAFTVVGFLAPLKTTPGPWSPYTMPKELPMHLQWVTTYETGDNRSYYSQGEYSQETDYGAVQGDAARFAHRYPHYESRLKPAGWAKVQHRPPGSNATVLVRSRGITALAASAQAPPTAFLAEDRLRKSGQGGAQSLTTLTPLQELSAIMLAMLQIVCVAALLLLVCGAWSLRSCTARAVKFWTVPP